MAVAAYQWSYNGLIFGDGTNIHVLKATGFEDLPEIRNADLPRPRDHGALAGVDYAGRRIITLDVRILGADTPTFQALVAQWQAATVLQSAPPLLPLSFYLDGTPRRIYCRPEKRSLPVTPRYAGANIGDGAVEFVAVDPRIYDDALTSQSIALPTSTGGLAWPVAWPLAWGTATSGVVTLTNAGTFPARPVVTFTGPITAPSIQNVTSGLTWASTLDLAAGDTLVVDFDARTVLLNGTASRYSTVLATSAWWELAPGGNQVRIGASAGSGSATITFRSTWI